MWQVDRNSEYARIQLPYIKCLLHFMLHSKRHGCALSLTSPLKDLQQDKKGPGQGKQPATETAAAAEAAPPAQAEAPAAAAARAAAARMSVAARHWRVGAARLRRRLIPAIVLRRIASAMSSAKSCHWSHGGM